MFFFGGRGGSPFEWQAASLDLVSFDPSTQEVNPMIPHLLFLFFFVLLFLFVLFFVQKARQFNILPTAGALDVPRKAPCLAEKRSLCWGLGVERGTSRMGHLALSLAGWEEGQKVKNSSPFSRHPLPLPSCLVEAQPMA